MTKLSNSKKLTSLVQNGGDGLSAYFDDFVTLACEHSYPHAALAFGFQLVEAGQSRALYGGLRREHRLDTELARNAVDNERMTRQKFYELYEAVFGSPVPEDAILHSKSASSVRDKLIHGKPVKDAEVWKALFELVRYATKLNEHVAEISDFQPFADMRGVTGKRGEKALDARTSKWVLKGMQFHLS